MLLSRAVKSRMQILPNVRILIADRPCFPDRSTQNQNLMPADGKYKFIKKTNKYKYKAKKCTNTKHKKYKYKKEESVQSWPHHKELQAARCSRQTWLGTKYKNIKQANKYKYKANKYKYEAKTQIQSRKNTNMYKIAKAK